MAHHGQIMGNEQIGKMKLILQLLQYIDNLGLDGYIQGDIGSSQTINSGSAAKALAMPILCLCPPENS